MRATETPLSNLAVHCHAEDAGHVCGGGIPGYLVEHGLTRSAGWTRT